VKKSSLFPAIAIDGTAICTDQLNGYRVLPALGKGYTHARASDTRDEWTRGTGRVQTIEDFWGQFKPGVNGTHIHVSAKHLPKYLGEFEYRWNMRQRPHLMIGRVMTSFAR